MIKIIRAEKTDRFLEFEICPNHEDVCKEEHSVFQFTATPPTWEDAKGKAVKFKGDWVEHCATEALRLVQAQRTEQSRTSVDSLVGKGLE